MHMPVLQAVDHQRVDIYTHNLDAAGSNGAGSWQADITQPEYTNLLKFQGKLLIDEKECAGIMP